MSEENVALTFRVMDAFNRRDLGAFLALMDADVEAVPPLVALEGGYHGHDGVRRWWESLLDAIPDLTTEVAEVRDLGDLTVAVVHIRGHGAGSDVPVEQTVWNVGEFREEKAVWWATYDTELEARDAVGLRE